MRRVRRPAPEGPFHPAMPVDPSFRLCHRNFRPQSFLQTVACSTHMSAVWRPQHILHTVNGAFPVLHLSIRRIMLWHACLCCIKLWGKRHKQKQAARQKQGSDLWQMRTQIKERAAQTAPTASHAHQQKAGCARLLPLPQDGFPVRLETVLFIIRRQCPHKQTGAAGGQLQHGVHGWSGQHAILHPCFVHEF